MRDRFNLDVKVVLGWVLAHRGIKGNEEADGIAKNATTEEKDANFKVPARDWRIVSKEKIWRRSQASLEREGLHKGVKYFRNNYSEERRKSWFAKVSLERGLGESDK